MGENTNEIMEFQIMVFTIDLIDICAPSEDEASLMIALAASYGPAHNSMTETD